jgi:hypothetical protein
LSSASKIVQADATSTVLLAAPAMRDFFGTALV